MKSTMYSINWNDFVKGLILAVIVPILVTIQTSLVAGNITFDWKAIGISALATLIGYLLKNFFTDDAKVVEKIADDNNKKLVDKSSKVIGVILILISFSFCGMAQSNFLAPIPKLKKPGTQRIIAGISVTSTEPTFWMLRPAAIAGTLYVGGTVEAAAGVGIAYQNITQKGTEQRNYVNYDIGIYSLLGGSVVSSDSIRSDIEKFVLAASALNGAIALGYGLSRQQIDPITNNRKWKGGLFLAWKINFNN